MVNRLITGGSSTFGYVPENDLKNLEVEIAFIAYTIGLGFDSIDDLTIDSVIETIRIVFPHFDAEDCHHAAARWINNRNHHLLRSFRSNWWNRHIVKGIIANG